MIHFNGNLLAAIDVETTGFIPGHHDIIQICVLLLDSDIKPDLQVNPFYVNMKPKRPENIEPDAMEVSRISFANIMQTAIDPWDAADLFDDWFVNLRKDMHNRRAKLPENRKLLPLAQNWAFDLNFVKDWLGEKSFFDFFHPWYRDTLAVAQFLNDQYAKDPNCVLPHKVPFPKSNLGYICSQLNVKNEKAHDALQDCIATAEAYRRMVVGPLP